MADQKSSLPDLNEIGAMAGKLFRDVKTSVCQIIDEYKAKRTTCNDTSCSIKPTTTTTTTTETVVEKKVDVKPTKTKVKATDDTQK